jgi:TorA maturation chaperone TorD
MENRAMMSQQAEKFVSKNPEPPSAGREAAHVQKGALFAPQDAEARGNMYYFLASVYLGPLNQDLVQFIIAKDFLQELCALFGQEAVANLKQFAATADPDKDVASLKQEYMDLFAVPTGRYVTPFEDVYLGGTLEGKQQRGSLMGQQAIAVRRMYRRAGAQMDQSCRQLPTQIGVELSFMSFLCGRQAAAMSSAEGDGLQDQEQRNTADAIKYRQLQIRFLQEHLNAWFPQLSRSILANAKTQFYRGLALITEAFLAMDTADLLAQSDS